jgi:hypothetical protein
MAISLHNIGEMLIQLENYSDAETKIQESLVISQEIKFKYLIAESFKALAEIAHQTHHPHLASAIAKTRSTSPKNLASL